MKAFFIECSLPFWVDTARLLAGRHGWDICYWTGAEYMEEPVREAFPDAVFHYNVDAVKGIPPRETREMDGAVLDEDVLSRLAPDESIVLKMMDRMAALDAFLYHERINHYHDLVRYWTGVLDVYKPDIVVTTTSPHLVYDYVLHALCRLRNIKTIIFVRTSIPFLIYPVDSISQEHPQLVSEYKKASAQDAGGEGEEYSERIREYLQRLSGDYSEGMPLHLKYKRQKYGSRLRHLRVMLSVLKNGPYDDYEKLRGHAVDERVGSRFHQIAHILRTSRYKKKLARYYDSICDRIDLEKPFIFVALQCQPERSTSPDGGWFVHLELVVDMVSRLAPEGWYVYVKEHVSQFSHFQHAERSRTTEFYDRIRSRDNVRIVPLSINSFDLIDAAKAVGVITGSVGFESLVRNTPILVFGKSWYNGCEGAFDATTESSCREAVKAIESGYAVDSERVGQFARLVEQFGFDGYLTRDYAEKSGITPEENARRVAAAIERHLGIGS